MSNECQFDILPAVDVAGALELVKRLTATQEAQVWNASVALAAAAEDREA